MMDKIPPITLISGPLRAPLIVRRMLRYCPERFRAPRSTYQANRTDCDSQCPAKIKQQFLPDTCESRGSSGERWAIGEYMGWVSEWQAISNRINGLKEAVQYFIQYQQPDGKDTLGKVLLPQIVAIYNLVDQFRETYKASIPPSAQKCISNYLAQDKDIIQEEATTFNGIPRLKHLFTSLISFQSELTFHFSDTQFVIRRITERALVHLQRLIVVDEAIRNMWENGFKLETECEKLGATHLLLHGIWAFKAHAVKGRTDLVLGEPVNLNQVEETSEGLVLTEWKLVKDVKDVKAVASVAYKQAKYYSGGVLAGIELRNYHYLVLVSEKQITIPDDIVEGEVTYKYKNIAISPDVPSTAAKKKNVA